MAETKKRDPLVFVAGCLGLLLAITVCGGGGGFVYARTMINLTADNQEVWCNLDYGDVYDDQPFGAFCEEYVAYLNANYPNIWNQSFYNYPFGMQNRRGYVDFNAISADQYWEAQQP